MTKKIEHNAATGETVERDLTTEELKQIADDKAASKIANTELAEKKIARQAVLDRLGITADEAALLLG